MFLPAKAKGFFVEQTEFTVFLARTTAPEPPFTVDYVAEFAASDDAAIQEKVKELAGKSPSGYAKAHCGVYPHRRFIRRASLDPKRLKDEGYYKEVLDTQFRIEAERSTVAVLSAADGSEIDPRQLSQKEVLFCGGPAEEFLGAQNRFLDLGLYPERLELGTVASLGALVSYLKLQKIETPTLMLEIGGDITHSFIVTEKGVDVSRPLPHGFNSMIPVVQKELGLKDEEGARKLFFSNTFDFTGMGTQLIKKLLKEMQSSIGFYEVQTGQSIGQLFCGQLPSGLSWLSQALSSALGVAILKVDFVPWLESLGIRFDDGITPATLDSRWLGVFSLMGNYHALAEEKNQ